jgi:hypothetical protein
MLGGQTWLKGRLLGTRDPPRCGCGGAGCVPSQGTRVRQTGLTGGKILLACG